MRSTTPSTVRAGFWRRSALSLENAVSIGFMGCRVAGRRAGRGKRRDRLADAGDLVGGQIVEHHDIAALERRGEDVLHVGSEGFAIHLPIENPKAGHA
jgi:hypothetical protein